VNASTERSVDRPGGRIVYRHVGHGPPLLLLHATLSSSRQLRTLAARLATRFSVISVDRRGSGESAAAAPEPAGPIDVSSHIEDLAAIATAVGLGPATVVGHSYGGCIAIELAARRPELVARLFAYEPPYGPLAPPSVQAHMTRVGQRALEASGRGELAEAALEFMAGVSGTSAVAALSVAARERVGRAGTGAVADATLLGMDPAGLATISCPALIATGALSAPLYADIATALTERIEDARHRAIPDADHMAPIIRPELIAVAVEEFSDR
jgi:pimeloyl-ACP methyl ester carboxylesterase